MLSAARATCNVQWQPTTHGAFWMCANYGITTTSGVMIFGGHYPDIGLQISWDDGRSWNFYVVDTSAFEANGNFLEVAPDEVLFMYGGSYLPKGNRMQRIRVDRERKAAWPVAIDGEQPAGGGGSMPEPAAGGVRQTVTLEY